MFTKPKSTTKLPFAMLYKRYVAIQSSFGKEITYFVIANGNPKYFIFNSVDGVFIEIDTDEVDKESLFHLTSQILTFNNKYYKYNAVTQQIEEVEKDTTNELIKITNSPNIGKYQLNKYYYTNSFQFTISGDIEESVIQSIKGLMSPIASLTLKTYSDIDIKADDLIVIEKRLYHIESVSKTVKRMPKAFVIKTLIVNSIL